MSALGLRLAAEAQALVGSRFRLHGRDPGTGLDCVGLVLCALRRAGLVVPEVAGYALRQTDLSGLVAQAGSFWLEPAAGKARPGDVLLVRPGPAQAHLIIVAGDGGMVHAHAGLARVVRQAARPDWPILAHWRVRAELEHTWQP